MARTVYLNGEWLPADQAKVSVFDRGFLFGDGVYEVVVAYERHPFRLEQHIARLAKSLVEVGIENPMGVHEWRFVIERLISINADHHSSIYIQVSRGSSETRTHNYPVGLEPTVFICSQKIALSTKATVDLPPCSAITLQDIRWDRGDIKSISLLGSILLKKQVFEAGSDEGILIRNGLVAEGTASNIFIVVDGVVKTPKLNDWILTGVTREYVFELCRRYDIQIIEADISLNELSESDEIWLTSTTSEIRPVISLNGMSVGEGCAGPLWKKVAVYYERHKSELFTSGS